MTVDHIRDHVLHLVWSNQYTRSRTFHQRIEAGELMESWKSSNHCYNSSLKAVTKGINTKFKGLVTYFTIQDLISSLGNGNVDDLSVSFL